MANNQHSTPSISTAIDSVGSRQGQLSNRDRTDDPFLTLQGHGEPLQSLSVFLGGVEIGQTTVLSDGSWEFPIVQGLDVGKNSFTVQTSDTNGDTSAPSRKFSVTIDTSVEIAVGISVETDSNTDTTPMISGMAERGSTVEIFDGNTSLGTTQTAMDGSWQLELALDPGDHALTAQVTDSAGNISAMSVSSDISIQAATAPTPTPAPTPATGSGSSTGGGTPPAKAAVVIDTAEKAAAAGIFVSNDDTPTILGRTNPGLLVSLEIDGHSYGPTQADPAGLWSLDITNPLPQGLLGFTATTRNAAGNTATANAQMFIDSIASPPPTIDFAKDDVGSIQGFIAHPVITDDDAPGLSGTGAPGEILKLYLNGQLIITTKVDDNGNWKYTLNNSLLEGEHTFTATTTDFAGNESVPSADFVITVDRSAPDPIDDLSGYDDVGSITAVIQQNDIIDDTEPKIYGTAEAHAVVEVFDNGVSLGTTTADGKGDWSLTSTLSTGDHVISATQSDRAGNKSELSNTLTFSIDTTAPSASISINDGDGLISSSEEGKVELTAQISPGDLVDSITLSDGNKTITVKPADYTVDPVTGTVTIASQNVSSLSDGPINATIKAVDISGNSSLGQDSSNKDTSTSSSKISIDSISTDTGSSDSDFITKDQSLSVHGRVTKLLAVDEHIEVSNDGINWELATYDSSTKQWSLVDSDTHSSSFNYQVRIIDSAGNVGNTDQQSITIDTSAPGLVTLDKINDNVGQVKGDIPNNGVSDDNRPTFVGTAEANSIVTIYNKGTEIGTAISDSRGNWKHTPSSLPDGRYKISVSATDLAGNETAPTSPVRTFDIDTSAIDEITFKAVDNVGSDTGTIIANSTTDDAQPQIKGSDALAQATIEIFDGNTKIGTTTANNKGQWSFTPSTDITEGGHSISVRQIDSIGRVGPKSAELDFTVRTNIDIGNISDTDSSANSVSEFASIGDRVGITANAVDPDNQDTVSYSLLDNAGGLFSIDAQTGVVSVAGQLDYENQTSHSIVVEAESSDGSRTEKRISIDVEDVQYTITIGTWGGVYNLFENGGRINFYGTTDLPTGTILTIKSQGNGFNGNRSPYREEILTTTVSAGGTWSKSLSPAGQPTYNGGANISQGAWIYLATPAGSDWRTPGVLSNDVNIVSKGWSVENRNPAQTPLILDLDGDGVEIIDISKGVRFDLDADGKLDTTTWVNPDDGLLVRDINKDGLINDAKEIFGSQTIKDDGTRANDGFEALRELDENEDGVFDQQDQSFTELKVWQDLNSDGISQENELKTLAEIGLDSINLDATITSVDSQGNTSGLTSTWIDLSGNLHQIDDIWFDYTPGTTATELKNSEAAIEANDLLNDLTTEDSSSVDSLLSSLGTSATAAITAPQTNSESLQSDSAERTTTPQELNWEYDNLWDQFDNGAANSNVILWF